MYILSVIIINIYSSSSPHMQPNIINFALITEHCAIETKERNIVDKSAANQLIFPFVCNLKQVNKALGFCYFNSLQSW